MISFVINTYANLSDKNQRATQTLTEIDQHLNLIDEIRRNISKLYRFVNIFLNNPEDNNHITNIKSELDNATEATSKIVTNNSHEQVMQFRNKLLSTLKTLRPYINELILIRRNTDMQYPGMSISANTMAEQQNTIKGLLNILQNEIENKDFIPKHKNLHSDILETRILVEKEISQVRIFIANRLALFSNEILNSQVISLADIQRDLLRKLNLLKIIYTKEEDSFEGPEAIHKIIQLQTDWYINFTQLRKLSESERWREDSNLMENKISPLIDKISASLFHINQYLRLKKKETTKTFIETSRELFYILSVIIGSFLLYIFLLLVSMDLMIFKPILNIAEVMKLKAFGHTEKQFSDKQSMETQNIITAFNELEKKVSSRTKDLKRAIVIAKEAGSEAKFANQAKSTFLANISHELRTPLHGILSFSDIGQSKYVNAEREALGNYFELIHQSGERLLLLLNDLLDLEKLEAGRVVLNLQEHDLHNTTLKAVTQLHALADKKQLTITIDTETTPLNAIYDEEKIIQVIHNLLSNSIKFTPENNDIVIDLKTSQTGQKNTVTFTITDSGIGIPEKELESVFDKFVQSTKTQTGAGGTGLGLAICQEIIKAHNGLIFAENTQSGGARFSFTLTNE